MEFPMLMDLNGMIRDARNVDVKMGWLPVKKNITPALCAAIAQLFPISNAILIIIIILSPKIVVLLPQPLL